jgi:hypothetical protein
MPRQYISEEFCGTGTQHGCARTNDDTFVDGLLDSHTSPAASRIDVIPWLTSRSDSLTATMASYVLNLFMIFVRGLSPSIVYTSGSQKDQERGMDSRRPLPSINFSYLSLVRVSGTRPLILLPLRTTLLLNSDELHMSLPSKMPARVLMTRARCSCGVPGGTKTASEMQKEVFSCFVWGKWSK